MKDCKICTDDSYRISRDGYPLCKQHYEEVEDLFKQLDKRDVDTLLSLGYNADCKEEK